MKVFIVGAGGREHALAWKLKRDDPTIELLAAPGNAGVAELARCLPVDTSDLDGLIALAEAERADLTIVGPEGPLARGIVDRFRERRLAIFGPTQAAAAIESSKVFAKQLMLDAGVPTARAERHTDPHRARQAARRFGTPVVIKASGLAAGKGVIVADTEVDADQAIDAMLTRRVFGAAGAEILVEECMSGEEVSLHFLTDGTNWIPFVPAQDHKRLLDGDRGPNTGGMGAYAPVSPDMSVGADRLTSQTEPTVASSDLIDTVADRIIEPTLAALRDRGTPFSGVLYAGLMLTDSGPKVVEFNCRMGDPEAQVILPLTEFPLLPLMRAVAAGDSIANGRRGSETRRFAVATVVAAAGYPEHARVGDVIHLPAPETGIHVFHAGTARNAAGELITAAGRVMAVTALASDLAEAQRASVDFAARVEFPGKHFRTDIAWRELARHARAS
jgi:phosphoribosylamine---glycine ligase